MPSASQSEPYLDAQIASKQDNTCHHPGYQSLTAQSWWCDSCLRECHNLPIPQTNDEGQWYDFFIWLRDLLIKGSATLLAASFGIIVFLFGKFNEEDDLEANGPRELQWLTVRRQELLHDIDRLRADWSRACFDGRWPTPREITSQIQKSEEDLFDTMIKIESLERRLSMRAGTNHMECLAVAQSPLDGSR